MARGKAYTVWIGRNTGVFLSWAECEASIKGFPGAKFKSFGSVEAAQQALLQPWENHIVIPKSQPKAVGEDPEMTVTTTEEPQLETAISGDDDEAPF